MSETWVCLLVVLWKHAPDEPEPDPLIGIAHTGTEAECEEKAARIREVRPDQVEVHGDAEVREIKAVTCPEAMLHLTPRGGLPS